jgi:hypothetical protein
MTASEQLKLNLAKARHSYSAAKIAVKFASTRFGLRDAKIAAERARLAVVQTQELLIRAECREDADEQAWLDA